MSNATSAPQKDPVVLPTFPPRASSSSQLPLVVFVRSLPDSQHLLLMLSPGQIPALAFIVSL